MTRYQHIILPLQAILLLIGCAMMSGCASDSKVIDQAGQVHQQLAPAVMRDAQLAGYIQEVGMRSVKAGAELDAEGKGPDSHKTEDNKWMFSDRMQFHFVNSKTLNAFTTGGEHMYIYTELFGKCRTEDELAAVVSHEYAHVYCRHVHKGMEQQNWNIAGAVGGAVVGAAVAGKDNRAEGAMIGGAGGYMATQFFGMGFTRADEAEADEWGFYFYTRAGWDPNHFRDFFQQMIDMQLDSSSDLMSDHPTLASRVAKADERARNIAGKADRFRRTPVADGQRFSALKARAIALGAAMPNDKSMEASQKLLASFSSCVDLKKKPKK